MNKRLVLVGMESKEKAVEYARELMRNLRDSDHIPVKLTTTPFCFETPHVEVWFIHDPRNQVLDGLRADAIYGWDEYREPLYQYAKPGCRRVNPVGLREFIVICEREYAEEQRKKDDYERYCQEDTARTRLAALQAEAIRTFARAMSRAARTMPEIDRARFAIKRVKLGKTPTIYWENGDKTSIVGPEWYCHSEMHAMAMLFNLRQQGIAQVIFNNPVTMVRWEDGSKVTVRSQEGDVYSSQVGLDMCIAKRLLGTNKNRSNYYDVFKKYLPKPEVEEVPTND